MSSHETCQIYLAGNRQSPISGACDGGICFMILSPIRFIRQTARILRNTDSKIIGRRFEHGPCFFPGFCNGIWIPWINSVVLAPVSAELFRMLEIFSNKRWGPCLRCSTFKLSIPGNSLFLNRSLTFLSSKKHAKKVVIMLTCCSSLVVTPRSLSRSRVILDSHC